MALLAGHLNVEIHQMDINTVFLYSGIDEVVYVEQPEGCEINGKEDWIYLLNKMWKQSPWAWFLCNTSILIQLPTV